MNNDEYRHRTTCKERVAKDSIAASFRESAGSLLVHLHGNCVRYMIEIKAKSIRLSCQFTDIGLNCQHIYYRRLSLLHIYITNIYLFPYKQPYPYSMHT